MSEEEKKESFFEKIFSIFLKSDNTSLAVKRELKQISKVLKKSRYKFYDPRLNELTPNFARFFYQLYRFFGPLQASLSRYSSSDAIKVFMVERNLSKEVFDLRMTFSEEGVRAMTLNMETKEVAKELQKNFALFKNYIAKGGVRKINDEYRFFKLFLQFMNYDYYYVLKKFDAKLPENDFVYKTKFEPVIGPKIIEELKDFSNLMETFELSADWEDIFSVINEFRGAEVVSLSVWRKVAKSIEEIKRAHLLEMIIAVVDENPGYAPKLSETRENIVAAYVETVGKELQNSVKKIVDEKKNKGIHEFVKKVFGGKPPANRVKNYSDRLHEAITAKTQVGFVYLQPINYLKSFFLDYLKKDVRDVTNHYLITGKWISPGLSQQFSESFHRLIELSDALSEFDKSLGEEFRRGQAIRSYTRAGEKDKKNVGLLDRVVEDVNNEAKQIIVESAQNLVKIAKVLRAVLEDYEINPKKFFTNWKELESNFKGELLKETQAVFKQVFDMVQLLQMFLTK